MYSEIGDGEEISAIVAMELDYRKMVGVKTDHSSVTFGGYGPSFTAELR